MDQPQETNPSGNRWLIAAAVTIPTFMEVLDTSIANVALRHIAGGLSAAEDDSEWVITSYLAANAIVLPISGWLSNHFGRRNYFLASVALFTLSSGLCGMATGLFQLILFRVLQGLAGGGLQPSTQAVLLDTFPPERQGAAMTVFGMAALIAPILGPTLGGWITDNYEWRWIFYINIPVGLAALGACAAVIHDPPYLERQRAELRSKPIRFDYIGLGLIALGLACLEVVLSKGQEWDWLGDPFWRAQTLMAVMIVSLVAAVVWELRRRDPVVDLRPLGERNFTLSAITVFAAFGALYGALTSLPAMLEVLFGYDATHAGLVMSPAGVFSLLMMPIVGYLLGRQFDARWLVLAGALVMAGGFYWMSRLNLEVSPSQIVWPRVVQAVGTSILFAPLNVAAYMYLPRHLRAPAVGLYNLLRNEGGSVGTSVAKTLVERRQQLHLWRLDDELTPFNSNVREALIGIENFFLGQTGDPAGSEIRAWQVIDNLRQEQALSLSYFDCFWFFAVVSLVLVPLALAMRRSVAEKGAHLVAE